MIGTKLAHYEITSHLGTGGMGEVYRARDTKLKREVAIKILPEEFARDADRVGRFQREAEVLASLNHPNIATIYDLQEANGSHFLVLELVEGETIADRIARGPIPLSEALDIAKRICEALEAAHDKGIVHRDLKPANIKITPEGKVKVLDFGLAKAFQQEASTPALSNSPTLSMAATNAGVILGTAAYMSPEQAKGRTVDKRTDIFAFGAVLYEMLTGRGAFEGEDVADILSRVLQRDPDWTWLPANVPPRIRELLRLCLEKNAKNRRSDATDVRLDIEQALAEPAAAPARNARLAWIVAAAMALVAVVFAIPTVRYLRETPPPSQPEMRVEVTTPPMPDLRAFALSPDGRMLAVIATAGGQRQLWLRSLEDGSARVLKGTEGAGSPFWSPDSRSIGFFGRDGLKRMDLADGSIRTLAVGNGPGNGATWNREGVILFAGTLIQPLRRLSSLTKSEPVAATRLTEQQFGHILPQFLPDGQHYLYYVRGEREVSGVYVGALDGGEPKRLLDADQAVVASEHVLFVRQGALFAQPFDATRLELAGEPFRISAAVGVGGPSSSIVLAVSASASGTVAFRPSAPDSAPQLIWFDREGKNIGRIIDAGDFNSPDLSRDGRRLALRRTVNGNLDIWVFDTMRGGWSRITSDETSESQPVWSPDGLRIAFHSSRQGTNNFYVRRANAGGTDELVVATPQVNRPNGWSPDGQFLLISGLGMSGVGPGIWAVPVEGAPTPISVVPSRFGARDAQVSPDGKWVAYQSEESGRSEIYAQPFLSSGERIPITTTGGAEVRWRGDGKELFYIALDGRLMAVPIRVARTFDPGVPVPLFATHIPGGAVQGGGNGQQYVVSPDGQRFLISTVREETATSPITLILNWKPSAK